MKHQNLKTSLSFLFLAEMTLISNILVEISPLPSHQNSLEPQLQSECTKQKARLIAEKAPGHAPRQL